MIICVMWIQQQTDLMVLSQYHQYQSRLVATY